MKISEETIEILKRIVKELKSNRSTALRYIIVQFAKGLDLIVQFCSSRLPHLKNIKTEV